MSGFPQISIGRESTALLALFTAFLFIGHGLLAMVIGCIAICAALAWFHHRAAPGEWAAVPAVRYGVGCGIPQNIKLSNKSPERSEL